MIVKGDGLISIPFTYVPYPRFIPSESAVPKEY